MSSRRGARRRKKIAAELEARLASRMDVLFETTEIVAELITDALETVFREDRWWKGATTIYGKNFTRGKTVMTYTADSYELAVMPNNILRIIHYPEVVVDATADLITDADKVEALLNWIYDGGQFPLTKEEN